MKNANLSAIKYLLKADIPLNVLDQEGNTVHHYAAETNKDIVSVNIFVITLQNYFALFEYLNSLHYIHRHVIIMHYVITCVN